MTTSYFPSTESARLGWAIHYRDQIAVHGPTVGLSAEEIAATQSDLNFYTGLLHDGYPTLQADAKAASTYKGHITTGEGTIPQPPPPRSPIADPPAVQVPGILTRVFAQIARINSGEWLALGADNSKPHYDIRPLIEPKLPEVREYRLRW